MIMAKTLAETLDQWEFGLTSVKRTVTEQGEIVSVSKNYSGIYQVICGSMVGEFPVVLALARRVNVDRAIVAIMDFQELGKNELTLRLLAALKSQKRMLRQLEGVGLCQRQ